MPATFYPTQLPQHSSAGQRELRERLGAIDGLHVIQDCSWMFINQQTHVENDSADCLILAPGQGVLILMLCEGEQSQVKQKNKGVLPETMVMGADTMIRAREALARAAAARGSLQRFLSHMAPAIAGDGSGQASRCTFSHGVALLPGNGAAGLDRDSLGSEVERFLDGAALDNIGAAIARFFALDGSSPAFSEDDIRQFMGHLLPSTKVQKPLKDKMAQAESALITLTQEQVGILQSIRHNKRAVILGGAGTGKTVLATEKARELARAGFKTLFMCYNKPLQEYLAATLRGTGVRVQNFHGLVLHQARMAGMPYEPDVENQQNWYETEAPLLLARAARVNGERFDALIIDETQDFSMDWIEVLCNNLLTPDGCLYHFADSHQNLYQRGWEIPKDFPIFELTINCRNTRPIARRVARIFEDPWNESSMQVKRLPEGPQPEFLDRTFDNMAFDVAGLAESLINDDGLDPGQLIVLTNTTRIRGDLLGKQAAGLTFTEWGKPGGGIPVETIHSFKGLERDAVIMAMKVVGQPDALRALSYVGMSRARSVLYVLADQKLKEIIHWDG